MWKDSAAKRNGRDPARAADEGLPGRDAGGLRARPRDRRQRVRRPRRPLGVREDDCAPHGRGPRADHGRPGQDRRPGREQAPAEGPGHRDGVPELRALPAHVGLQEHGLRPPDAEGPPAPDRQSGTGRRPDARPRPGAPEEAADAVGRARQPFLMDEPLSNLDAKLRVEMRAEIARLQRDLQVTTIYVTHDQTEAMTLGDRVAVMRDGLLQQVDVPQKLYDEPANLFVAEFIGSPAMNLVDAEVVRTNGRFEARFGDHRLAIHDDVLAPRPALTAYEDRHVALGIRPEDLKDAPAGEDLEGRRLRAVVDVREDMGSEGFVHFGVGAPPIRTKAVAGAVGEEALEALHARSRRQGSLFVARLDQGTAAREGEPVELAVKTKRLHFFDPVTGDGIYGESPYLARSTASSTGPK